jgi:hypothetical protein
MIAQMVKLVYKTREMDEQLRQSCTDILSEFRLPDRRLLCFFDVKQSDELAKKYGEGGIHIAVGPKGLGNGWPHDIQELLGMKQLSAAFDNLIYIPGDKYSKRRASLTVTLAHEVQHFLQCIDEPTAYSINCGIAKHLDIFTQLKAWEIPYEIDAMQRSKQVGNALLGSEAVEAFTIEQIEDATSSNNGSKLALWHFFQSLSSEDSNIREETLRLLARSETELREMPDSFQKLVEQLQAVPSK